MCAGHKYQHVLHAAVAAHEVPDQAIEVSDGVIDDSFNRTVNLEDEVYEH